MNFDGSFCFCGWWRDTIEFQTNLRRILIVWSNIFTSYFILVRHPFLRFFLWGTSGFVFHIHLQRLVGGTSIFSQIKCFYSVLLGSFFKCFTVLIQTISPFLSVSLCFLCWFNSKSESSNWTSKQHSSDRSCTNIQKQGFHEVQSF